MDIFQHLLFFLMALLSYTIDLWQLITYIIKILSTYIRIIYVTNNINNFDRLIKYNRKAVKIKDKSTTYSSHKNKPVINVSRLQKYTINIT